MVEANQDLEGVQLTQIYAAFAAYFGGGWKNTPDALCLRGFAQQIRSNFAESTLDLACSLAMKINKAWRIEFTGVIIDKMLGTARCSLSPSIGIWTKVTADPGKRYASA